METQIKRWGNSAAIRIPSSILSDINLTIDSQINIEVKGNSIVIEPVAKSKKRLNLPFNEQSLIEGLDAHSAHADSIAVLMNAELGE
jgi:antitoxin MazE